MELLDKIERLIERTWLYKLCEYLTNKFLG